MIVKIIFKDSNAAKVYEDCHKVYFKADFVCIHFGDDILHRYPRENIWLIEEPYKTKAYSITETCKE